MDVISSNIKSIDYKNNNLIVEYLKGSKYEYKEVPLGIYNRLCEAESKGRFINSEVKGKFDFRKLS